MLFFVTVAVLLASANAAVLYRNCGSTATIEKVDVMGREEGVCVYDKKDNVTISIDFTPTADVSALNATVSRSVYSHALLKPLYPTLYEDACQDNGLTCPIKGGEKVSYRTSFPITETSSISRFLIKVTCKLEDADGNVVVCVHLTTVCNKRMKSTS